MGEKTITLKEDTVLQCHLMPCLIDYDNSKSVKAKEYFWPTIKLLKRGSDDEKQSRGESLTASFRGRPLQGRKVGLPDNYEGFVINKDSKLKERSSMGKFKEFTYWNWDEIPSNEDSVMKALQWINISKAIHG